MKTMGTENADHANFPQRPVSPFASSSQSTTPFLSSGPVVGSEAFAFRPAPPNAPQTTPSAPQTTRPYLASGLMVGSEASGFRPTQTVRYNDPSIPPPPSSYAPLPTGNLQHYPTGPTPQFISTAQAPPPRTSPPGQPVFPPPIRAAAGHVPSPPVYLHPQPQISSGLMGSPPQSINYVPSGRNVPPPSSDSLFSAPRSTLQPLQSAFPGYSSKPSNVVTQPTPVQSTPVFSHQGGYGPPPPATSTPFLAHQRGYVPPPPVATPPAVYSREQMQHQGSGLPMGAVQGLTEDFSSLSLASVPGSLDPGLDSKVLPRPLDGDVEPKSVSEMYPLNCNSRYLRLTTSAIPNSQSLTSRWHLPLGAVVCPLAEAPDGEEVPIVNFATTGIIRCRRCRAYVNPYVTFTDGGRKFRCNICALLNDVPGDYFAQLDASGTRIDLNERPELTKGSVDFIAPAEYMVRPPMPPLYFFVIDVSISAVSSGMLEVGTLAKYTGGQIYYYQSFQSSIHKEKLRHELARDLTRETAWESVLRIRCGKGVRFTSYHGNFMLRSTDLIALPAVDCDKAYAMQMSLEETLLTTQTVYFQVALLYTSSSGERRIRVHTAAAPVVSNLGEMYRQADTGAIISLFCRLAIEKTLSYKLEEARSSIQQRIVKAFREYRNLYAVQHRLGGKMIYPEPLKFLPLYGLALCKSIPLRGGYADAQLDERCAAGHTMMTLPVKNLLKLLYPNLVRVDEYLRQASSKLDEFNISRLPVTAESLDSRGLYIYDDGLRFVIWFGKMLPPDIAMSLLGEDFATDFSRVMLSERDSEMSRKLMEILKKFREIDPSYYQVCHLVRQGEQPREGFFLLTNLVEDKVGGMNGYVDWIQQIHRQVQQNA
ncbi:Protein transport protein Sec24-like [Actinidia chinensis var. chinensis]|uniref:Protein transport protein Sec24-like n=1 Tax=Actinidia chinensis var. chinensis TaxID=1590841 RepID=A0A2R6QTY3_ACTCC|nr:Protein transport protein Sec24-like [Actinidia chinensis var. chinensis]